MTISHRILALRSTVQQGLARAHGTLRERRQARAARRQLKRELASYTTIADVDDLLGSLRGQDEASIEEIRTLVARNLQDNQRGLDIAS